ncbi:hypothetical protein C8R43DRAFT_1120807 [Mycena crocata]|nr:hypothetical protein C8R43DRAFT_1120807 [Mycena crocata]
MLPVMYPNDNMEIDAVWDTFQPMPTAAQLIADLGVAEQPEALDPEETRGLLRQEYERMLIGAYEETQFDKDGLDGQFLGDDLPKESPDNDDEDDDLWDMSEYRPYPSKPAMLLDVLDNLPRCWFTSAQMNLIIHFARQLGVMNVPSLKGLCKIQKSLQAKCGHEPVKIESPQANIFYMNDIHDTLARNLANPLVAPHMHFYPELVTKGPISETFQAERWMEYTPDQLTPMFSKGHKHFWLEELARCADGTFVIPHTWIVRDGILTSDVSIVRCSADGRWHLDSTEAEIVANDLEFDYDDLIAEFGENLDWADASQVPSMPNTMRKLVEDDEDLYVLMVSPWADDVSGNWSKQYNKHMNMYTGNGCLPGRLLQQEFHVHYVLSSPHASSAEQFAVFRTKDKITQFWITQLISKAQAMKVENPRRTADDVALELMTWLDQQPGDKMNPLLDIAGLDPSQDTPVELLHTILLGVIKYIWHHMNTNRWSDSDHHLLAIRLQSTNLSGLTVPPIRAGYMIQYKNNLIGKHFKTLMQILPFHVHHLSTPEEFALIKAASDLGARLWVAEIDDMDQYLGQIKIAVANLLDVFDAVNPWLSAHG